MTNLEIVTNDEDIQNTVLQLSDDTAYVIQTETDGRKHYVMLHQSEAKQLIAGLTAFLEGKLVHASDCALHNSPAYPIEACDCGSETSYVMPFHDETVAAIDAMTIRK